MKRSFYCQSSLHPFLFLNYILISYLLFQFSYYLRITDQDWNFKLAILSHWFSAVFYQPAQYTDYYISIFTLIMITAYLAVYGISKFKRLEIDTDQIYWSLGNIKISHAFPLDADTEIQHILIPPHNPDIHLFKLKTGQEEFNINMSEFSAEDQQTIHMLLKSLKIRC
jgi:hypothetical protein